jgi:PIN domain nuclease of toxin-antitoxin system
MLIAQALVEGIMLLTEDANLARYPGPIQAI